MSSDELLKMCLLTFLTKKVGPAAKRGQRDSDDEVALVRDPYRPATFGDTEAERSMTAALLKAAAIVQSRVCGHKYEGATVAKEKASGARGEKGEDEHFRGGGRGRGKGHRGDTGGKGEKGTGSGAAAGAVPK